MQHVPCNARTLLPSDHAGAAALLVAVVAVALLTGCGQGGAAARR